MLLFVHADLQERRLQWHPARDLARQRERGTRAEQMAKLPIDGDGVVDNFVDPTMESRLMAKCVV